MITAPRITLIPLRENHKEVEIRVTKLETFMNCQVRYNAEPPSKSSEDYFVFGHVMHTLVQQYCSIDKSSKEWYAKAFGLLKLYPEYLDVIEPYFELVHPLWLDPVITNAKMYLEIELGQYLIILTWEIDMLVNNGNGRFGIVDFKFPQSEWDNDDFKLQKVLYPYLVWHTYGFDRLDYFEYIIMTKHHDRKKRYRPRLQQFRTQIIREEVELQAVKSLKAFAIAQRKNEYKHSKWQHCFTCKLKSECPMW